MSPVDVESVDEAGKDGSRRSMTGVHLSHGIRHIILQHQQQQPQPPQPPPVKSPTQRRHHTTFVSVDCVRWRADMGLGHIS